nr:MAG TPA: hypothetical protein [Inoviridae sp.]
MTRSGRGSLILLLRPESPTSAGHLQFIFPRTPRN